MAAAIFPEPVPIHHFQGFFPESLSPEYHNTNSSRKSTNSSGVSSISDPHPADMDTRAQPLRLSLKHGASMETIASYVTELGNSLRRRQILKVVDTWTPSTADVRDCYRLLREVGRGHFGVVRLCEDVSTNQMFACKTMLKSSIKKEEDVVELCSEVLSMIRLQHKLGSHAGIVQLHEILEDADSLHLIIEYCAGGDLFDHISHQKRLTEKESAHVLKQLAVAVRAMHTCGIVHRDLKPENVLLTKPKGYTRGRPEVKVADFGLAMLLRAGQHARGVAGSPFYMAPEVVRGKAYGREVDVWSLGVILYTSLAGCLPFWGKGHEAVFAAVLRGTPDFVKKPWPLVSPEAKNLVRAMLNPEPLKRISLQEVLAHPWMLHHCPELKLYQHQQQPAASQRQLSHLGLSQLKGGAGWGGVRRVVSPLSGLMATSQEAYNNAAATFGMGSKSSEGKENAVKRQEEEDKKKYVPAEVPSSSVRGTPHAVATPQQVQSPAPHGLWELPPNALMPQGNCQRYGSPTWVIQLAAQRMREAEDAAVKREETSAAGDRAHQSHTRHPSQDLHAIPSPPRAPIASPSPCSSPSLLHKVQAALSLAHPFPRLYMPFGNSGYSPVLSPFQSPPPNIFAEVPAERPACLPTATGCPKRVERSGMAAMDMQRTEDPPAPTREVSALSLAPAAMMAATGQAALALGSVKCLGSGAATTASSAGPNSAAGNHPTPGRDAFKKLSVFISSPTCLSPMNSCHMSPSSAAEVAQVMRLLEEETPQAAPVSAKAVDHMDASPYSLAENFVSALFSPADTQ